MLTGTALAQIIPVAGSLVLARLFAPAEFGIFSAWLGIVFLLGVLLTGRFETALAVVPDGEPRRLAVLSTFVTVILAACAVAVLLAVTLLLRPSITDRLPKEMVFLLIPAAVAIAFSQIFQSWAAAEGKYRQLTLMRIAQTASVTSGQILIGALHSSATALAVAQVAGVFLGLAISVYLMPPGKFPKMQARAAVLSLWRQYQRFPKLSLPADAINTAATQLPLLIVTARFGAEVAGLLAMTMRILGAPIGLLGKSILDVFKRHAATSYRERGECRDDYVRTFKVLLAASLAFCVFMGMFSEQFFALAFGEKWRGAGTIAIWLLPMFALSLIASPLSYMVYIAGKQHVDLVWQIALLAMTVATLSLVKSHNLALQAYSAGYSMLYVIYLAMSYRFSLGIRR